MMQPWEYRHISFADRVKIFTHPVASGCHEFRGRRNTGGYGQMKDSGKAILVHRWVWEQINGAITDGIQVLHKCDNPCCVNPDHLFLGTHLDNMKDKAKKGRSKNVPRGAAHPRHWAKVTTEQVVLIKERLRSGERQIDIAREIGVSPNLISEIKLGKTWAHVA